MLAILAAASLAVSLPPSPTDTTAIVGATIIDGRGGPPVPNGTVIYAGGRIVAVGPSSTVRVPAGAQITQARGKFLIPGLMDGNVHLVFGASIEYLARYENRFEDLIEEAAQVALKNGLTTLFDSWGPLRPLLAVRDRIRQGETVGSRLFVAGNIIGFTGPLGSDFNGEGEKTATKAFAKRINDLWEVGTGPELMWLTPDSLRLVIRKYAGSGMDFLKYGASGHQLMEMLMFSPEQQRAIVEEGHRAGIIVQTHSTSVESLRQAIEAGVDMLQHCSITGPVPMSDATIQQLKDRHVYCAVQAITKKRLDIMSEMWANLQPRLQYDRLLKVEHENEVRMIKANAPMLLATDAGITDPDARAQLTDRVKEDDNTALGEAHFFWFQAMAEKGMKPMDALVAATRNVAAAYHKLDDFGTLEVGKRADMVVLDADPLKNIMNVRKISAVIKDGITIDRDALPLKRIATGPGGKS